MGCGGSSSGENSPISGQRGSFQRQPKVEIRIGDSVTILDKKPRVIFVFGGPGTKKGKLLDNMANVFNFEVINVENVILEELAKELENPELGKIVPAIQQLLKGNPELLKLESVLRMVARRLDAVDENKFCVVDFMPNLKWMLSNPSFIKECASEFKAFEEKYPISFVIHFVIPKEKVLNKIETDNAKHPGTTPAGKQDSSRQSDEADSSRTQKRVLLYENSVMNYMEYFEKREKIVTIDVSCGQSDVIWNKICDFFAEFNFKALKSPETVIVFGFDEKELEEINLAQYSMNVISLREVANSPSDTAEMLMEQVCRYVDTCKPTTRLFVVDGTGTSLTKDLKKKRTGRKIIFTEGGDDCRLSRYCPSGVTGRSGEPMELQAVASLENEVCLFNRNVSQDLCKWISSYMIDYRKQQHGR